MSLSPAPADILGADASYACILKIISLESSIFLSFERCTTLYMSLVGWP